MNLIFALALLVQDKNAEEAFKKIEETLSAREDRKGQGNDRSAFPRWSRSGENPLGDAPQGGQQGQRRNDVACVCR